MQTQEKKLVLKVQFKDFKFKQVIKNPDQTSFSQLKPLLLPKIQEKDPQINNFTCLDSSDFEFDDEDLITDCLKESDPFIKISPLQNQKQSDAQIAQNQQLVSPPDEAIVVLFDVSGSMGSKFFNEDNLSRMGATNAFFSAFADKTMAFELNHLLSLYTFSNDIYKKCDFMTDYQNFINLVDSANPGGCTRLYDCIQQAIEDLLKIKKEHPNITLRILALTDGEDNRSQSKPLDLIQQIIKHNIILDSFVVSNNCIGLKTLTQASGGKCFKPSDINEGLQLFEIETTLSTQNREKSENQIDLKQINLDQFKNIPFDFEGNVKQAKPKEMKQASQSAEQVIQAKKNVIQSSGTANQKRIYKELQDCVQNPHPNIKYFPTAEDINTWKVLMIGPKDTTYNLGTYQLLVKFPSDYPFKPPKVQFINKIYHCNISSNGGICLDILKDCWSPALTISKIMLSLQGLLSDPNPDDALESNIASEYRDPDGKEYYAKKLKEQTLKYADQSVEELLESILGQNVDKNGQFYQEKYSELTQWIKTAKQL